MLYDPAEIFKVLSVDTRINIIELLKVQGPLGVKDISSNLGLTPPAISQHLKILKQAGLVRSERKGYWIPYSINVDAMDNCRELLNEVCTCGCQGTGKFKEQESRKANLETLKKYEDELQKELKVVRERIGRIEAER